MKELEKALKDVGVTCDRIEVEQAFIGDSPAYEFAFIWYNPERGWKCIYLKSLFDLDPELRSKKIAKLVKGAVDKSVG
jgi:hypothetical protein